MARKRRPPSFACFRFPLNPCRHKDGVRVPCPINVVWWQHLGERREYVKRDGCLCQVRSLSTPRFLVTADCSHPLQPERWRGRWAPTSCSPPRWASSPWSCTPSTRPWPGVSCVVTQGRWEGDGAIYAVLFFPLYFPAYFCPITFPPRFSAYHRISPHFPAYFFSRNLSLYVLPLTVFFSFALALGSCGGKYDRNFLMIE